MKNQSIPLTLNLPSNLEAMTIGELARSSDAEVHYKNGKLSVRRELEDSVATLEVSTYPSGGRSAKISSTPKPEKKYELLEDIKAMKKEGMSQKDIAFQLGMSPAYVSKLLSN